MRKGRREELRFDFARTIRGLALDPKTRQPIRTEKVIELGARRIGDDNHKGTETRLEPDGQFTIHVIEPGVYSLFTDYDYVILNQPRIDLRGNTTVEGIEVMLLEGVLLPSYVALRSPVMQRG